MRGKRIWITAGLLGLVIWLGSVAGWNTVLSAWLQDRTALGREHTAQVLAQLLPPEETTAALPVPEEKQRKTTKTTPMDSATPQPEKTAKLPKNQGVAIQPTTISGGLRLNNATGYSLDAESLLAEEFPLRLPTEGPQILIMHTHGSECYTPESGETGQSSYHSQDKSQSVVAVGDALAAAWQEQGLSVLHDTELYDYPSYNGSYSRSGQAVEQYLSQYPGLAIVIDLHRDALGVDPIYKVMANENTAQLMLLAATGENGLWHPDWRENLKLAVHLQAAVQESFPTLARPIAVKPERYNQQLTHGSLILEVGTAGNTLAEAKAAVEAFASATGPFLQSLISQ